MSGRCAEAIMAQFSVVPDSKVVGDVKRVFEEIRREKRLPFVPNFFKTLAHAPQSLEATWMAYRGITTRGALPEALKEMIFVAISVARGCKYCEAAHLAFCNLLNVEREHLAALSDNIDAVRPERTKDVVRFSVKCAMEPRNLEEADYARLRHHGITDSEIIETITMCGFAMFAITVADAFKLNIDHEVASILETERAAS
jgi:uncharacterized peroxidase-related enzyme